jgi:type II secretory pathway component PulF
MSGAMAIEIKPAGLAVETKEKRFKAFFSGRKISAKERMFLTERLALLLETGGTLQPSLQSLQKQTSNPALAKIIAALADDVMSGRQLSVALAKYPELFSKTYVMLIQAGEQGGFMAKVLQELQKMEQKREKLRQIIVSSLSYPVFLIIASLSVMVFVLVFVFPKFGVLFESIRDQLPITTIMLMTASDALRHYWYLFLFALAGAIYLAFQWLRSSTGKTMVDKLKLSIPGVKDIFVEIYLVQSFRILSLSLDNGVSLVDAITSCHEVTGNRTFRAFMEKVHKSVREGQGFAAGFLDTEFIPDMVGQMIITGEQSGNLATVMDRVADFYERELENKVTFISKIIEPLMLLLMGVVVGLMVSSLILPIFKLSRAVH